MALKTTTTKTPAYSYLKISASLGASLPGLLFLQTFMWLAGHIRQWGESILTYLPWPTRDKAVLSLVSITFYCLLSPHQDLKLFCLLTHLPIILLPPHKLEVP